MAVPETRKRNGEPIVRDIKGSSQGGFFAWQNSRDRIHEAEKDETQARGDLKRKRLKRGGIGGKFDSQEVESGVGRLNEKRERIAVKRGGTTIGLKFTLRWIRGQETAKEGGGSYVDAFKNHGLWTNPMKGGGGESDLGISI